MHRANLAKLPYQSVYILDRFVKVVCVAYSITTRIITIMITMRRRRIKLWTGFETRGGLNFFLLLSLLSLKCMGCTDCLSCIVPHSNREWAGLNCGRLYQELYVFVSVSIQDVT